MPWCVQGTWPENIRSQGVMRRIGLTWGRHRRKARQSSGGDKLSDLETGSRTKDRRREKGFLILESSVIDEEGRYTVRLLRNVNSSFTRSWCVEFFSTRFQGVHSICLTRPRESTAVRQDLPHYLADFFCRVGSRKKALWLK